MEKAGGGALVAHCSRKTVGFSGAESERAESKCCDFHRRSGQEILILRKTRLAMGIRGRLVSWAAFSC